MSLNHSAQELSSVPTGSQYVSADTLLTVLAVSFSCVFKPDVVKGILDDVAKRAGITFTSEALTAATAHAAATLKGKQDNKKMKVKADSKPRKPRKLTPYMIYTTKCCDFFKSHPPADSNGGRGGVIVAASHVWSQMPADRKQQFQQVYQPLCEELNKKAIADGHNTTELLRHIQHFEKEVLNEKDVFQRIVGLQGATNTAPTPVKSEMPETVDGDRTEERKKKKKKKKAKRADEEAAVEPPSSKKQKRDKGNEEGSSKHEKKKKKHKDQ